MNTNNISVSKVVLSFFTGIAVFFVVDLLADLILNMLFAVICMIPIDMLRNLLINYLFMVNSMGESWVIIFASTILAILSTKKIVFLLNKDNAIHREKSYFGIGIALIVWGSLALITNIMMSGNIIYNIAYIVAGIIILYTRNMD